MTATRVEQLALEQKYFDRAWDERERARRALQDAPSAAAGSIAAVRAVRKATEARLADFASEDEAVAVGRFDLDDDSEAPMYVGKHAILDAHRDILVINWQAPAARPFYEATIDDRAGVTRIRKFETANNEVLSFEDIVLAALAERVGELTDDEKLGVDDALLRDLESDRNGEMQDIVQTIHASQYDLIRRPLEQLLVVQGGPGTGKTAVALHRVSWLLFNHRGDVAPEDFLIIGPSKTFGRYIQKLLPGLGNDGVPQTDLRSLGPLASDSRTESYAVTHLKGQAKMAGLLARALHQRVRFPERTDTLNVGNVTLSQDEVEEQLERLLSAPTYNAGRAGLRDWIASTVGQRRRGTVPIDAQTIDQATERVWPALTPPLFLQELLGSRQRITSAGGDDFTTGDVDRLHRTAAGTLRQETWSDSDVALLDEVNELINGRGSSYAHIVVDEAQDLSPMQLRSVRRRSSRGSYTIVGDLAQSTGPFARNSWLDVVEGLRIEHEVVQEQLDLGYRVPRQVTDLADLLLPLIAPELVPATVVRRGPTEPEIVHADSLDVVDMAVEAASGYASRGLFTGIICAEADHIRVASCLRSRSMSFNDADTGQLSNSINLMTADQSKGLEFDAVVVVEPAAIAAAEDSGLRHLYIAITRTTRHLTIAHSQRFEPLGIVEGEPDGVDLTAIETITEGHVRASSPGPSHSIPQGVVNYERPSGLRGRAVRMTAEYLAEEVRSTLGPDAFEDLVKALADELGVLEFGWDRGKRF